MKKPTLPEVRHFKEVVKRWYFQAKHRNKTAAELETKMIYEMLKYLEKECDLEYFD